MDKRDKSQDKVICVHCEQAKKPKVVFTRKNIEYHTLSKHPLKKLKYRLSNVQNLTKIFNDKLSMKRSLPSTSHADGSFSKYQKVEHTSTQNLVSHNSVTESSNNTSSTSNQKPLLAVEEVRGRIFFFS